MAEWITLVWQIAFTLIDKGLMDKSQLPKDFPKNKEELEKFIMEVTIKNADKIFAENFEVVETWD